MELYYPCSENKGADQLRGYREAGLRLCFRIGNNPVFLRCGSNANIVILNGNCLVCLKTHANTYVNVILLHANDVRTCVR